MNNSTVLTLWMVLLIIFHQEIEKRKKAEEAVKAAVVNARKQAFIGGPDFEVMGMKYYYWGFSFYYLKASIMPYCM